MKLSDPSGLLLEEQPEKATEAILLFLQGCGYYPSFSHCQWVKKRAALQASPAHKPPPPDESAIRELKI